MTKQSKMKFKGGPFVPLRKSSPETTDGKETLKQSLVKESEIRYLN